MPTDPAELSLADRLQLAAGIVKSVLGKPHQIVIAAAARALGRGADSEDVTKALHRAVAGLKSLKVGEVEPAAVAELLFDGEPSLSNVGRALGELRQHDDDLASAVVELETSIAKQADRMGGLDEKVTKLEKAAAEKPAPAPAPAPAKPAPAPAPAPAAPTPGPVSETAETKPAAKPADKKQGK